MHVCIPSDFLDRGSQCQRSKTVLLLPSQYDFFSFSYYTGNTILKNNGKEQTSLLCPDFRGKSFIFHSMFTIWLFIVYTSHDSLFLFLFVCIF